MPVLNDWENFGMKDFIAYCGLDCVACEARLRNSKDYKSIGEYKDA